MAKKNALKKILALTLAAALILSAGPLADLCGTETSFVSASASEEITDWTDISDLLVITENEIILKDGVSPTGNIEIPSKINGIAVKSIAPAAFKDCTGITAVKIPDGIETIGGQAFENCGLETVYLNANSCKGETNNNFWRETAPFVNNNNLTRFVFGENVNNIPENICCNVKSLNRVEFKYDGNADLFIGDYAFFNCKSLESIDLSKVNTIGVEAFSGCSSLTSIGNGGKDGKLIFGNRLREIKSNAFFGCKAIEELTIPENTQKIGVCAFADCDIKKVYFNASDRISSDTTTKIIETSTNFWEINTTFKNNSALTDFVFGENVSAIPAFVCRNIPSLKNVKVLGNFNGVGESAFEGCNLENIHLESYSRENFDFDKLIIASGNEAVKEDIFTFGLHTIAETNNEFNVTVSYSNKAFNSSVKLSISEVEGERENGSIEISDQEIEEQIGCFNIKMILADGSSTDAVQPNGEVTVKMAIPEEYVGRKNYKIVHRCSDGTRENFTSSPSGKDKKLSVSSDGNYWIFNVSSFSEFEFFAVEPAPSVSIKNKSESTTINYGDILRLTAVTENLPDDANIYWYVNDEKLGEGEAFDFTGNASAKITVKIVDENGNDYAVKEISDSQSVTVKAGFFQKLISFFKNLFRLNRIIE